MVFERMQNHIRDFCAPIALPQLRKFTFPHLRKSGQFILLCLTVYCGTAFAQMPPVVNLQQLKTLSIQNVIRFTLLYNPDIHTAIENTKSAYGAYQKEMGAFDASFNTALSHSRDYTPLTDSGQANLAYLTDQTFTKTTTYTAGLSKELSNGIVLGPNFELDRNATNIQDLTGLEPENAADLDFSVSIPLLKGTMPGATALAAGELYQSALYTLQHQVSQSVLTALFAYWDYVEAQQRLQVALSQEKNSEQVRVNIKKLIDGNEKPRSDMNLVMADLSSKQDAVSSARSLLVARQAALANAMGLGTDYKLPPPSATYPQISAHLIKNFSEVKKYQQIALRQRTDIQANQEKLLSDHLLLQQARVNLRPDVKLNLAVGYDSLNEGDNMLSGATANIKGINTLAKISYAFPIGNNAARGTLRQRAASIDQTFITLRDLKRSIVLQITADAKTLQYAADGLRQSNQAVTYYQKAVDDSWTKFKAGINTLVDYITITDNRDTQRLQNISRKNAYVKAILQYKFDSGILVTEKNGLYSVHF